MILSLESYSAVIIRLDLSRDCPPYDPVTPLKALGLSWASVLPLCRLIGPQLIYLLLLLWLLLWLYYVWSAAYAPMPRPHPSSGSGQCHLWPCEKFHFRSSQFRVLNTLRNFRLLSHRFVIVLSNKFPPTYDHNVHSLRRVKGCHNAQKNWRRWNGNNRNR